MPKKTVSAPKKVAEKKVATKKSLGKKTATKVTAPTLVFAPDAQSFWVADGQILNSLAALATAFAEMEKAIFTHHVTAEKNDFADWVELVLGDVQCASSLRKAKTPKTAHAMVVKRLKVYAL